MTDITVRAYFIQVMIEAMFQVPWITLQRQIEELIDQNNKITGCLVPGYRFRGEVYLYEGMTLPPPTIKGISRDLRQEAATIADTKIRLETEQGQVRSFLQTILAATDSLDEVKEFLPVQLHSNPKFSKHRTTFPGTKKLGEDKKKELHERHDKYVRKIYDRLAYNLLIV